MLVAQCGVVGVDRVYGVDAPQLMHGARVHVDAQVDHGEPCIAERSAMARPSGSACPPASRPASSARSSRSASVSCIAAR